MAQYFGPPLLWCFVQVDYELWNYVVPLVSVGLSVGHALSSACFLLEISFGKKFLFSEIVQ